MALNLFSSIFKIHVHVIELITCYICDILWKQDLWKEEIFWSISSLSCVNERVLIFCRQTLAAIPADVLDQVKTQAENCDVIGIDEGQFVSWWWALLALCWNSFDTSVKILREKRGIQNIY